jgi:hypothetical protein
MLTAVGSAEGEASIRIAPLGDDAVVVVECLFYGNEDADVGLGLVGLGCVVPCFGVVVAWCVLAMGLLLSLRRLQAKRLMSGNVSYQQPACPWAIPRKSTSGPHRP